MKFTESNYSTTENNSVVTVCVSVEGRLGTNITVKLDASDGTAQGKSACHHTVCILTIIANYKEFIIL